MHRIKVLEDMTEKSRIETGEERRGWAGEVEERVRRYIYMNRSLSMTLDGVQTHDL